MSPRPSVINSSGVYHSSDGGSYTRSVSGVPIRDLNASQTAFEHAWESGLQHAIERAWQSGYQSAMARAVQGRQDIRDPFGWFERQEDSESVRHSYFRPRIDDLENGSIVAEVRAEERNQDHTIIKNVTTTVLSEDAGEAAQPNSTPRPQPQPQSQPQPRPRPHWFKRYASIVAAFVKEWTPFCLVSSYFIFSTCLYMLCSAGMISVFWFIYLITNFYIAGATVVEAVMSLTPCRDARKALAKLETNKWRFPTPDDELPVLDLVTVAYLPNEKDIILDRIQYMVNEIVYPINRIRINIVYNTPFEIEPLETKMRALTQKHPQLRVIKVPGSTSKADNLNYFFTLNTGADVIAVFDCDHYPHPCGPRWAAERFMSDQTIDIVQGRCVIYNARASLLSAMIAVEFDKIYAVSHPGRAATWDFGLFTGSNGYWRGSLLRELKMHGHMLTEDIDSSLRAVSRGANTVHDMNVISYEMAPTTISSFWKQRLRWAQGWAQASWVHSVLIWNRPIGGMRSTWQRLGLLSLLGIRESAYYLVTQYCCLVASILIMDFPTTTTALLRVLFFQYPVAYWLFVISVICLFATLVITYYVRSEFITFRMIIIFSVIFPFYLIVTAMIGLYGHARQVVKYTNWNPTART